MSRALWILITCLLILKPVYAIGVSNSAIIKNDDVFITLLATIKCFRIRCQKRGKDLFGKIIAIGITAFAFYIAGEILIDISAIDLVHQIIGKLQTDPLKIQAGIHDLFFDLFHIDVVFRQNPASFDIRFGCSQFLLNF